MKMLSKVKARLSKALLRRRLKQYGVNLLGAVKCTGYKPEIDNEGSIIFGDAVDLRGTSHPVRLTTTSSGEIILGNNAFLNNGVRIYSCEQVEIGPDAKIGDDCVIYDTNFHPVHEGRPVRSGPVKIGRNVWLGRGVVILPGVTIGDHSVVGANSVVSGVIPAREIWRGNPAQRVGDVRASDGYRRP